MPNHTFNEIINQAHFFLYLVQLNLKNPRKKQGWFFFSLVLVLSLSNYSNYEFLSSPSACRTSGASKNRDWPGLTVVIDRNVLKFLGDPWAGVFFSLI